MTEGGKGEKEQKEWSSLPREEGTKVELGIRAKGRKVLEGGEAYRLREPQVSYPDVFGTKNADIDAENSYFWNTNPDIST
jgi:hypothetical protein